MVTSAAGQGVAAGEAQALAAGAAPQEVVPAAQVATRAAPAVALEVERVKGAMVEV